MGNSPSLVRGAKVHVLACDTSYSDMSADDQRGKVFATVSLRRDGATVAGKLADGTDHKYAAATAGAKWGEENAASALVGRQLPGGKWVKTAAIDGRVQLATNEGFRWNYEWAKVEDIDKEDCIPKLALE